MDLFERLDTKPILTPADVIPSRKGLIVRCVINPGAFVYHGRVGLLLRVCEHPPQEKHWISIVILDENAPDGLKSMRFHIDDPKLESADPRVFVHDKLAYLTTLSHLRLAWSDDGKHFKIDPKPSLEGQGPYERYGIEDCRVTELEGSYHLTYTAVSEIGVCVGHSSTTDFKHFARHGLLFHPHNKDCVFFPQRIGEKYYVVHRPTGETIGGNFMWMSTSPDLVNWGNPRCLLTVRREKWDSERVGVNGPPILTDRGWLLLYHGANHDGRYSLGALVLDRDEPWRVLKRSDEPIFEPIMDYEKRGFFSNIVFCNGHVLNGDQLTIYYGAADEYVGAAKGSVKAILSTLK